MLGRRVLVVDDERYIVELVADLLGDEGYDVDRAYDGLTAEAAIERERPDLVIADVMMPNLGGIALAYRLRERPDPPVVLLMSAAIARPRAGDIPFIAKPFDIDEMLSTVRELIDAAAAVEGSALG